MTQGRDIVGGLPPGTRFGRYACVRRIARGGMGELYLAKNVEKPAFGKFLVLKRMLPQYSEDEEFVRMFRNEVRIAALLDHPGIAQVIDYGEMDDEYYLVMEYVHGENLRRVLSRSVERGELPLAVALAIAARVADALHYAHERHDEDGQPLDLVHRDISPANVLVSHDGAVKIIDFGIAAATAHTRTTRAGTLKGKVGYMSPEQCRGGLLDRSSDIFSLGVLLYELTTVRRLFRAANDFAVMNKIIRGEFAKPSEVVPDYPSELEAIVVRALAVDAGERPATARDLQRAVEEFALKRGLDLSSRTLATAMRRLFGEVPYPTDSAVPLEVAPVTSPPPPTTRRTAWAAVLAAAIGGGGFAVGVLARGDAPAPSPVSEAPSPDQVAKPVADLAVAAESVAEPSLPEAPELEAKPAELPVEEQVEPVPAPRAGKRKPRKKRRKAAKPTPKPNPTTKSVLPPHWREG